MVKPSVLRGVVGIATAGLVGGGLMQAGLPAAASASGDTATATVAHHSVHLGTPKIFHVPAAGEMFGVDCASVKRCVAVGAGGGTTFSGGLAVPVNNGKDGKVIKSSDPTSIFWAVSCVSTKKCVIVGSNKPSSTSPEGAQVWLLKGRKLSSVSVPTSASNAPSEFRGVDCPTAKHCEVVGGGLFSTAKVKNRAVGEIGKLSLSGTPSLHLVHDKSGSRELSAVSCPTSAFCVAGGSDQSDAGTEVTLASGSAPVSHPQPTVNALQGIACLSATSCEASEVQFQPNFQYDGWLEHLNAAGTGTPRAVAGASQLFAIATLGKSHYVAVGYSQGAEWLTDVAAAGGKLQKPAPLGDPSYLQGVDCPSAKECVAVGFTTDPSPKAPGGAGGTDGAVAVFKVKIR